ncbi:sulfite oxidase heme-binding subunit YedZ [Vibrio palustris]|uniref:Protein-methionine-sulfoxide reductase heme-binding subunit MsrQ n=1 Tax=Vibrio palustris TaxID=1918946 RepID=A0A1R4B4H7_9VIBR|nr:protein-methionine-sulfoxide reductase heme-binding subunit MsrQ [Vibrio palustris]SJL83822.1 Sulfoxide reductase heme-binding subunit YedZ [Vibrio palustris]
MARLRWRISPWQRIVIKALLHITIGGYLTLTVWFGIQDKLGADPVDSLLHFTGIGAINLLLFTLCISPLSRILGGDLMRFRRLLGIYVFVYALCHMLTFIIFILGFDWSRLTTEIAQRPYITVGFSAVLLLFAFTATSPNIVRRKMGSYWQKLHRWVYLALFLMLLHFTWSQKTLWGEPIYYWGLACIIMLPRITRWLKTWRKSLNN